MNDYKKGKKNKLKVGDVVGFTPHCVEWHATNLVDNYSQKHDCYFGREIVAHLEDVHGWLDAYLSKKTPKGIVVGYGSEDEKKGYNCVRVEAKFKHCKIFGYFSEVTDLKRMKK